MPPYEIPDKIDEAFVQGLVDRKQPESKHFEFKQQLNIKNDSQKQRFLAHASAFANTEGGFLIYGIKQGDGQLKGKASEVYDVSCAENDDDLRLKIEDLIRKGISPGLIDTDLEIVLMASDKRVLILHVPESKSIPHMVTHSGINTIYKRHSSGIYSPDLEELRQMISSTADSEPTAQRIQNFREERIRSILEGNRPVSFCNGRPLFLLHVFPDSIEYTRQEFIQYRTRNNFRNDSNSIFKGKDHSHCIRVFRDGRLECVYVLKLKKDAEIYASNVDFTLGRSCLSRIISWQKELKVSSPLNFALSVLNVGGYKLVMSPNEEFSSPPPNYEPSEIMPIGDKHLRIDEVRIQLSELDEFQLMNQMKLAIDEIWQHSGWDGSINYNNEGKWRHS